MTILEMCTAMLEKEGHDTLSPLTNIDHAPKYVSWVPRLWNDVQALREVFKCPHPPRHQVRPKKMAVTIYQFGDASGQGFGSSLALRNVIYYGHGQWHTRHADESSNFHELGNLIFAIEDAHSQGLLDNAELFFFTDNSTAEAVFYKGTSSSEKLFNLILRLCKLQIQGTFMLHVIHISGQLMILQGTDGLSCGQTWEGAMSGDLSTCYVPLHLSCVDRQGHGIKLWVKEWLQKEISWLTPTDWFSNGHKMGYCAWTLPPAAADAALEQLGQSIHKRPHHFHIVLVPRLMTSQ